MDFKLFWVGIFIFLIACNPSDYRDPRNKCEWFLKNSTGSTIILLKNFDSPNYNIVPNDSTITVYGAGISSFEETPDMFNWILDAIVLEDSLTIFDSNSNYSADMLSRSPFRKGRGLRCMASSRVS